jgi:hypothetical protein
MQCLNDKETILEIFRWVSSIAGAFNINNLNSEIPPTGVSVHETGDLVIVTPKGPVRVLDGYYVVKDSEDNFWAYSPELFETLFVSLPSDLI